MGRELCGVMLGCKDFDGGGGKKKVDGKEGGGGRDTTYDVSQLSYHFDDEDQIYLNCNNSIYFICLILFLLCSFVRGMIDHLRM